MKWFYDRNDDCTVEAMRMIRRILESAELLNDGFHFQSCSLYRHWCSEIHLDGLAIVPDDVLKNEYCAKRKKFLPIEPAMVQLIRETLLIDGVRILEAQDRRKNR